MNDTFDILIMNGRPASGKSEIVDFLLKLDTRERRQRFHLGELIFLDDFPMLWAWFEQDHLLQTVLNKPPLFTDADGYFKDPILWHLLIERLGLEYQKLVQEKGDSLSAYTVVVEFSRGTEHGGYRDAYDHLPEAMLQKAAILYNHVSFEESLRKNRARFNPDKPHSILEHALPDRKLKRLYAGDDFMTLAAQDPHFIEIKGVRVPYAVFENEDDVTTAKSYLLRERLEVTLARLWDHYQRGRTGFGGQVHWDL